MCVFCVFQFNRRSSKCHERSVVFPIVLLCNSYCRLFEYGRKCQSLRKKSIFRFINLLFFPQELDYIGIAAIEAIFCMFASGFWVFIYCLYATHMTTTLLSLGTVTFQSKWYNYPIKLRPYLILMIRRSQKSFYFNGFKIIRCDLESFATVR